MHLSELCRDPITILSSIFLMLFFVVEIIFNVCLYCGYFVLGGGQLCRILSAWLVCSRNTPTLKVCSSQRQWRISYVAPCIKGCCGGSSLLWEWRHGSQFSSYFFSHVTFIELVAGLCSLVVMRERGPGPVLFFLLSSVRYQYALSVATGQRRCVAVKAGKLNSARGFDWQDCLTNLVGWKVPPFFPLVSGPWLSGQGQEHRCLVCELSDEARQELEWWGHHFTQWNGRSVRAHNSSLTIKTDILKKGWAVDVHGSLPFPDTIAHYSLELLVAFLAVKCFARGKQNVTILLKMDSMSALTYINKLVGTISQLLNGVAWRWCMGRTARFAPDSTPGKLDWMAESVWGRRWKEDR